MLREEIDNKYKWNLADMIKDDEEYKEIVAEIEVLTSKIEAIKGEITKSSDNLYHYLEIMDSLNELLERLYVYSYLYHYQDMSNEIGLKYKSIADNLNDDIGVRLAFTSSELMSLGYENVLKYIKEDKRLEKYAFSLEKTFRYEKHILSEKEENIIAEASKAFGTPDEVFSNLDNLDINLGTIKDENNKKVELNNSNYIKYMSSDNRRVRKEAFKKMYDFFKNHINTISAAYLGCIKEDFFSSNVRGFASPLEQSLYNDKISGDFYKNFIEEIHDYLPLMYKYMNLRNKALGYKSHMYDIYVDLEKVDNNDISYEEGIKYVNGALKPLGESYLKDLNKSFTEGWVDAMPNKFKRSGAYQWGSFGVHPYVSLNYESNPDSVSTMAHELGHAMHSYYSNEHQNYTYANYPIFLAEIASTVNEVLVDDYFYKNAKNDEEKIVYLQNFLDKVRTTIFRQTMFAEFEMIMHEKHSKGEALTSKEFCETYYDLNKLYFGKNVVVDEEIKYEWARIPHFYTPFYVYKYATGLVSALSIAYDILNNEPNAKENYLEFLKSGGSLYPLDTLKKANVDITDPAVIKKAFSLFKNKLDELETLIKKKDSKDE